MDPFTFNQILGLLGINAGLGFLGGLFGPDEPEIPEPQQLASFEGGVADPEGRLGQMYGFLESMIPGLIERAAQPVTLRGAVAQNPPTIPGAPLGIPFDIGVTAEDPALSDPSLLTLPGWDVDFDAIEGSNFQPWLPFMQDEVLLNSEGDTIPIGALPVPNDPEKHGGLPMDPQDPNPAADPADVEIPDPTEDYAGGERPYGRGARAAMSARNWQEAPDVERAVAALELLGIPDRRRG